MKQFLLITIITLFSFCSSPVDKKERAGEPDIYNVEAEDKEMNEAIKTANATLDKFSSALNSRDTAFQYFSIKVKFKTPAGGGEHIWISNITLENGNFAGVVSNVPEQTTEVKAGDLINIKKENISDWMYLDKGKLRGGYTILAIRNKLPVAERKQFDLDNGLIIED